jgi:hypothetical protein
MLLMRPEIIVGHDKHVVSKGQHVFVCAWAAGEVVGAWASDGASLAKVC